MKNTILMILIDFFLSGSSQRKIKYFIFSIFITVFCSCDSKSEWSSGDYAVYWIDVPENLMLGRKLDSGNLIGRVEPKVFAVGEDDSLIVAASRDMNGNEKYYYLRKSLDSDFKNGHDIVEGPFTKTDFLRLKSEIMLPDFQKYFR